MRLSRIGLLTGLGIIFFALIYWVRTPFLLQPIERDLGTYATVATLIWERKIPYRDFFDHHQPLTYIAYMPIVKIAPYSTQAVRVAATLLSAVGSLAIFEYLRRIAGLPAGLLAALLFVLVGSSQYVQGIDLHPDHLFGFVSVFAVLWPLGVINHKNKWIPTLSGAIGGLAVLTRLSGAIAVAAVLVPLIAGRKQRGHTVLQTIALYAVGGLIPLAAVMALYAALGSLPAMLYQNVTYNFAYLKAGPQHPPLGWLGMPSYLHILVLAGIGVAGVRLLRTRGRDVPTWTILLWLAGTFISVKMARRDYAHYFVQLVFPAVCLLSLPLLNRSQLRKLVSVVVGGGLAIYTALPFWLDVHSVRGRHPDSLGPGGELWALQDEAGAWIRERAEPDDRLFVIGNESSFYYFSGVLPATSYIYELPEEADPNFAENVQRELREQPPRFVVLPYGPEWPTYAQVLTSMPYHLGVQFGPTIFVYVLEPTMSEH